MISSSRSASGAAARWRAPAVAVALALACAGQLSASDPPEVAWRSLVFEAKKWTLAATAEVRLGEATAAELEREQLAVRAPTSSVLRLEILSQLFGRRSSHKLWIDGRDARALKRRVVERGRRKRVKVYRYGRESIRARRTTPADDEEAKSDDPRDWTEESRTSYPKGAAVSGLLTEPAAILYLVSALEPSTFEPAYEIWTFTSQRPVRTRLRKTGVEPLKTAYRTVGEVDPGPRTVEAIVYAISPQSEGEPDFELLGLEGELEIAVESSSRIPLEIRGRMPILGRVVVRLLRAELAE